MLADTQRKRAQGFAAKHPYDIGVIFTWPTPDRRVFWMKGMDRPLSVAFLNEQGVIFQIVDMQPDTGPIPNYYFSDQPTRIAIEVTMGWFGLNKISVFSRLYISPDNF